MEMLILLTVILGFASRICRVWAQTETVYLPITYCPLSADLPGASSIYSASVPYFLYIDGRAGVRQYTTSNGTLTTDPSQAAFYYLSSRGQLTGDLNYVSTAKVTGFQPFALDPQLESSSTTFVFVDGRLQWNNDAFHDGHASFCVSNDTLYAILGADSPSGCLPVVIATMRVSSFFDGGPVLTHSPTTSASSKTTSTSLLPACSLTTGVTDSAYPAPTAAGTPNCFERSIYDGTVNNDHLILCHTTLSGNEIEHSTTASFQACIETCSYLSSLCNEPQCVAVAYDSAAGADSCRLFRRIDPITRGSNATIAAAIVVNQPYAPPIVFNNSGTASSASSSTTSSTMSVYLSTTKRLSSLSISSFSTLPLMSTSVVAAATTPLSIVTATSAAINPTSLLSTTTERSTAVVTATVPSRSRSSSTTVIVTATTTATTTSSPLAATTSTTTGLAAVVSPTSTSTSTAGPVCQALPLTSSLCPEENGRAVDVSSSSECWDVRCSTTLVGTVLIGNSTTAVTLRACVGFCEIYNAALPDGCAGVNYLGTQAGAGQNNCLLLAEVDRLITGTAIVDAVIYDGYADDG